MKTSIDIEIYIYIKCICVCTYINIYIYIYLFFYVYIESDHIRYFELKLPCSLWKLLYKKKMGVYMFVYWV